MTPGVPAEGRVFGNWKWQVNSSKAVVPDGSPNVVANSPAPPSVPTDFNYPLTQPTPGATMTVQPLTNQCNWAELVGVVVPAGGTPPAVQLGAPPKDAYPTVTPAFWVLGCNSISPAPASGFVNLVCNDNFRPDNLGAQAVRVFILTQGNGS